MEPSSQDVLSESVALEPESVALEPEPPSEAVVIKKRGRPKGSLNKKTIERMKEREPSPHTLDVDFTSDEVLGETPPKRKAKPKPPPSPSSSEEEDEDVAPPPPPPRLKRATTRRRAYEVAEQPLNPPSYLEVLTRGLKEARAQQHAEKIAQYDRFFAW